MSLTAMQDIGGCRVIVDSIPQVYAMIDRLKSSRMRHHKKEEYDYIATPKPDGYRSYHIVFSYFSDKNQKYNGLFIEIQIRTHIDQATAQYDVAEKTRDKDEDVVLVSTSSYNMLKQAYPNYFSDITEFITLIEKFVQ